MGSCCDGEIVPCSDANCQHRSALASLNRLDMDKITRDGDSHHKVLSSGLSLSTAALPSPTTTYPGPPPPYSCSSSATPSNLGAFEYISPPSSRRTTVDDKASGPRQSLPSIQEALGGDGTKPFSVSDIVHPLSATSRTAQPAFSFGAGQALPEAPSGPPNPFSQVPAAVQPAVIDPYVPHSAERQDIHPEQEGIKSTFPSSSTTESLAAPLHTFDIKSPRPRSSHPMSSNSYNRSNHTNGHDPLSDTSPSRFPAYTSSYTYSTGSSNPPSSTFPSGPDYSRFNPAFKFDDRKQSIPRSHPVQPYSDSVKRHLDIFDIEMALNEVRISILYVTKFG